MQVLRGYNVFTFYPLFNGVVFNGFGAWLKEKQVDGGGVKG